VDASANQCFHPRHREYARILAHEFRSLWMVVRARARMKANLVREAASESVLAQGLSRLTALAGVAGEQHSFPTFHLPGISSPPSDMTTIILDPIAVRLHYSWQPITPIPLCWNSLEPRLFPISTSSTQAPSRGLSFR
jgi:hypothetical protein